MLSKNFFKLGTGYSFSFILNLFSVPFLARLYTPDIFGVWAFIIGVNSLIISGFNLRADIPIVMTKSIENASSLFRLSIYLAVVTFIIFCITFGNFSSLEREMQYLIYALLASSLLNQNLVTWQTRLGHFGNVAIFNTIFCFFFNFNPDRLRNARYRKQSGPFSRVSDWFWLCIHLA